MQRGSHLFDWGGVCEEGRRQKARSQKEEVRRQEPVWSGANFFQAMRKKSKEKEAIR
jgi:hypothetical protein